MDVSTPFIMEIKMIVIVYAVGSFEPYSSSSMGAVWYFRFRFLERKTDETDA